MSFDRQILLFLALEEGQKPFLRLFHRLDRLTSGAVLFARRPEILARLSGLWKEGRVERLYLAIVEGQPAFDVTTIDAPIARDPTHSWRFRVAQGGKPARTELKVLGRADQGPCTVLCRLVTGRTHQVRVHFAFIGHPLVGDPTYGFRKQRLTDYGLPPLGRQFLHAHQVTISLPGESQKQKFTAALPQELEDVLGELRQSMTRSKI